MSDTAAARMTTLPLAIRPEQKVGHGFPPLNATDEAGDEQLLVLIHTGNREAFSTLFRRFAESIHRVGRRVLRDQAEADDLVQEVFLYIHRKSGPFDRSKGSARSWIIQVAYTQALMRRRRLKAHGFYLSGITDKPVECDHAADQGAHYDQSVEGLFGRNGWRRVLESLTEDQRETLRLHFFEGYTFEEIAEKLGQSYGNIRNHHYRGLKKVRKHLTDRELNRR
jgi:RNA polymerase sigma-70 factor, ECF subfamily